ncbi:MAG TPA: PrgI family protein [Candidatus Saccharimonadales bacterium]|nr:PrgI family protein [Candidatus Saccharimonadales bacterium]
MAVYKVPQDVEADDKLIGPFSFRQFIYIIIAIIAIGLAWGLAQIFVGLALIPLPLVVLFGALALPLRKDQPMEIYLAAVVSFHLKPRKRLWLPDGIQSLVEITAPKVVEIQRTKDLSQSEAEQRLSYLANIVDTGGWAVRGVSTPTPDSAMQNDVYYAAQQTEDVLDTNSGVAQSFNTMINQAEVERREEMIAHMKEEPKTTAIVPQVPDPYASLAPSAPSQQTMPTASTPVTDDPHLTYNPYPNSIHQTVINPLGSTPRSVQAPISAPSTAAAPPSVPTAVPAPVQTAQTNTSEAVVSPDIINLANNSDLSIETIAHEANRIHEKEEQKLPDDEVVISLR